MGLREVITAQEKERQAVELHLHDGPKMVKGCKMQDVENDGPGHITSL